VDGGLMATEMAAQPEVLAGLASRRAELVERLAAAVPAEPVGVVLVARGSSDHAAVFGRYALEAACRRPVALAAPSLHTLYGVEISCEGYVAVGVSQSGRTPEITAVLERLRAGGARSVAITNQPDSPIAEAADAVIDLGAGEELAVPATKTFTAQLAAFALLAEAMGEVPWGPEDWARLPDQVSWVLEDFESPGRAAAAIADEGLIAVGRGYLYSIALEAALKLKETASVLAEGLSAADLRHGPIAVVERGLPVLAFRVPGPAEADMIGLIEWLRAKRAALVVEVAQEADAALPLPPGPPEPLATIPAAVRAQQLAYRLALARGMNPDAPVGLTKVTPTS
jgi:glucosamine--fructose-6-phosphate aminotransferase (isomerizing)